MRRMLMLAAVALVALTLAPNAFAWKIYQGYVNGLKDGGQECLYHQCEGIFQFPNMSPFTVWTDNPAYTLGDMLIWPNWTIQAGSHLENVTAARQVSLVGWLDVRIRQRCANGISYKWSDWKSYHIQNVSGNNIAMPLDFKNSQVIDNGGCQI